MTRTEALRASTAQIMRWDVLNQILSTTKRRRLLEIGVQFGNCGAKVRAEEKWGVDPAPKRGAERRYQHFFEGTSDDFFRKVSSDQRFDVVLVDGLHHAEQVERDVNNALRHLSEDGAIVLHDCNPLSEPAQRVPRQTGVWNGDCWKAMVALRRRPDLDAFTIEADHGIGVVRRRANPNVLPASLKAETYADLEAARIRILGLVHPASWFERFTGHESLGRVVVVSAIFGRRDEHRPAPPLDVDDYVMFTDGPRTAPGWRLERVASTSNPRLEARRIKTLALDLVDADVVVWIDGRIRVTAPIRSVLRQALESTDIAGYPHPWRKCAYDEASECASLELAPRDVLEGQAAQYRSEGFPERSGLWNTMVLARRRSPAMVAFGRAWWEQIQKHSVRDQVSFPYLLWRHGIQCGRLGRDVYRGGASPYFERGRHRV